ncbi:MAG: hypothetical protein ACP5E5_09160 [Acidobacteriaceae bacterium]
MSATAITSVATVFIAAFVAIIGFNQWRISRDKLRLDLFNRRFDVYLRVLDYYQEVLKGEGVPSDSITTPFIKAVRESRFIFPKASGVHQFLEEFRYRADKFAKNIIPRRDGDFAWINDAMPTLETMMEPYVKFEKL